jgi:hypothetical protein
VAVNMAAKVMAAVTVNVVAKVAAADKAVQWQGQKVTNTTTTWVIIILIFCGNTLLCVAKTLLCFEYTLSICLLGMFVRYRRETISMAT